MGVRAYLRSPVALAWTLVAVLGVGATVAAGWQLAVVLASSTAIADAAFLDGLGVILLAGVVAGAVLAVAAAVWLPCSAAIAYAVGRRVRGRPAGVSETTGVVRARSEPLYRWAKTLVAIGPIADRILTEADTAPTEIAAGCGGFVVPAIALDAATLPSAVERANRVVPQPGRQRVQLSGLAGTAILAAGFGWLAAVTGTAAPALPAGVAVPTPPVAVVAAAVVGLVVTAAVDAAWRAGAYAGADPDSGFAR